jgi:hypothetical protein
MEKGLKVHPFLGESLVLLKICIKSLAGSIAKELINLYGIY